MTTKEIKQTIKEITQFQTIKCKETKSFIQFSTHGQAKESFKAFQESISSKFTNVFFLSANVICVYFN